MTENSITASLQTSTVPKIDGWFFGFLGVLGFSLTLPATRLAVMSFDPMIIGLGRGVIAAMLALPLLLVTRQPFPTRHQWRGIFIVFAGAVVGFPVLSAFAMRDLPASHGAILLGLLPLATAIAGTVLAHERPSRKFWIASVMGSIAVLAYAHNAGSGQLRPADLLLLGAVILAAMGYAEGARVARELGGWQVICWALVLAAPLLIGPLLYVISQHGLHATPSAWAGFIYVSVVSMFLAFFAWYHGLAIGGVAHISQIQLIQPFMTLGFSALILGESFGVDAAICATVVAFSILVSRRSHVALRAEYKAYAHPDHCTVADHMARR